MEYLKIRTGVLLLQSIPPLSLLYTFVRVFHNVLPPGLSTFVLPPLIAYWLLAEAFAFTCLYLPYKHFYIQRPARHPPPLSRQGRELLVERCLATVDDVEHYLQWWFRGSSLEAIRRENVRDLLHWAFFQSEPLSFDEHKELQSYLDRVEAILGRALLPGKGKAICSRTTLDPVKCTYRSLVWNCIIFGTDCITSCTLLCNGFKFFRLPVTRSWTSFPFRLVGLISQQQSSAKYITYWNRPHLAKDKLPVVFIHGVGIGLWPYTTLLKSIDHDVGIIAVEIMAVSSRITHEALDRDVLVDEINSIVAYHGWYKFVLVGHSYGTIISTHLLKSPLTSPKVASVVLVDPICFLLHLPDVAYNFTVRKPSTAQEMILWYFGSMDIGIAHTLGRRFFWTQNVLWKEDLLLPDVEGSRYRDMTVVLSEKDDIVNVEAVKQYLNNSRTLQMKGSEGEATDALLSALERDDYGHPPAWEGRGLETVLLEELHHAQPFDFEHSRKQLVRIIETYSAMRMRRSEASVIVAPAV